MGVIDSHKDRLPRNTACDLNSGVRVTVPGAGTTCDAPGYDARTDDVTDGAATREAAYHVRTDDPRPRAYSGRGDIRDGEG